MLHINKPHPVAKVGFINVKAPQEEYLLVQEENLLLVQEEDPLLVQEDILLTVPSH